MVNEWDDNTPYFLEKLLLEVGVCPQQALLRREEKIKQKRLHLCDRKVEVLTTLSRYPIELVQRALSDETVMPHNVVKPDWEACLHLLSELNHIEHEIISLSPEVSPLFDSRKFAKLCEEIEETGIPFREAVITAIQAGFLLENAPDKLPIRMPKIAPLLSTLLAPPLLIHHSG